MVSMCFCEMFFLDVSNFMVGKCERVRQVPLNRGVSLVCIDGGTFQLQMATFAQDMLNYISQRVHFMLGNITRSSELQARG